MTCLLQREDVMFGNKSAEEKSTPPQQTYRISFILKSPQRRQQSLTYLWSSGVITTGDTAKSTTRLLVICVLFNQEVIKINSYLQLGVMD